MNILVIAAHPDDEVLGCGGSIAKWSRAGYKVYVLIMAEGVTSRDKTRIRDIRKNKLFQLKESAQKAGNILGVKSVTLLDFPDNRMDSLELLDIIKEIESVVYKLKPEVVVSHHSGDLNIDHRIVHESVMTACRPQPGHPVKRILSFEVASSTEWQSQAHSTPFLPNWFEDISGTLDVKIKALKAYHSEMRKWPHARSVKAVEYLAKWRGASVGSSAAEAFVLLRELK